MNHETLLISATRADYFQRHPDGAVPATGYRAYLPAVPELELYYEPHRLTEARTGYLLASGDTLSELGIVIAVQLDKHGPDRLRELIAQADSLFPQAEEVVEAVFANPTTRGLAPQPQQVV